MVTNAPVCSDSSFRKILLIGNINRAFLDADAVRKLPCQVCGNMLDGIEAAAKNSFRAIGVVMSGTSAKLSSALKALRAVNADAKIILLAQMYEEPAAIQLVGLTSNGVSVADDYLICPVQSNRFYESVTLTQRPQLVETAQPLLADERTEAKIRHLEKMATEDELTGLKNRRYIWEFSRQIIGHAKKENGRVTLLVFDIDNFKHYNDIYGHLAGDEVLRQAAVLMRRCCRGHDVVGRIGGDEFAVVFWDDPKHKVAETEAERRSTMAEHPKEVIFIANRFRAELNKAELHLLGPQGKGVLTISGGLASFPRDGSTIQELFSQADKALLDAKRSGKNRIYLVGPPPRLASGDAGAGKPQSDIADVE